MKKGTDGFKAIWATVLPLSGTADALDELMPYLQKQGYEFVTVPEMRR